MSDNFWSCPHQCDARTCPACLAKYGPIPARPDPLDAKIAELERNQCPVTRYPQTTGRCERLSERDRLQEELSLIREEYAKSDKHVRDAHREMAELETLVEHWKWQQGEAHDRGDRMCVERDEALAEAARLREALEAAQPYVEHMGLACTKKMVAEALAPRETRGNNETVK